MRRPTFAVVAALGLLLGCGDSPVGIEAPPPEEDPPEVSNTAPDFSAVRDLLDDPLVQELLTELADPATDQMVRDLLTALSAPANTIQTTTIQTDLARLQERLIPLEGDSEGELPRSVLGLIVADAAAVLATP